MKSNGQDKFCASAELALRPFILCPVVVDVRDAVVQQEKKHHTSPKTDNCRHESKFAHFGGLVHSRNQQTPDRCGHHHSGSETGKRILGPGTHPAS